MARTPVTRSSPSLGQRLPQVVVVTTAMLTFISFWRAAAIVLNDLASSAYYAGGIAEQAIGKAAPWFILAVMLLSYAVRSVYIESCSMFVRGGVYRVVKEAMGGTMAKISVSALMFDYILTGPISGVSAGQYLASLLNDLFRYARLEVQLSTDATAAIFAAVVTVYFWWINIKGIPESGNRALRIMYFTTVVVVLLIGWCGYTVYVRGAYLPPWPVPGNLRFSAGALGWLRGTRLPSIAAIAILIGLGHSVLAMSGEETLAQVYREIEHPKLANLKKTALVIFVYSLVFTSLVSLFAVMIIPDQARPRFFGNLIGGLTMFLVGPTVLRIVFHVFVVFVGVLILSGAVNTSIVGSNGVLNRVSEDGVLPDWFRRPHFKFGSTYRIITGVAALQLLTIVLSRGNVYMLGEAYAFGVVWSFVLKSVSVLVLRFTRPGPRAFRVPLNLRLHGVEIPVGLGLITLVLLAIAVTNLFTKPTATIAGISFSLFLFVVFTASEKLSSNRASPYPHLDKFRLIQQSTLLPEALGWRPGGILVGVGNYHTLSHLAAVLSDANVEHQDVIVLHIRTLKRAASGEHDLAPDQLFSSTEQLLFTKVVAVAEKEGKPVRLAIVPANDVCDCLIRAAANLQCRSMALGQSSRLSIHQQARLIGLAWERLPEPRPGITLEIYGNKAERHVFFLGPHTRDLSSREIELLHSVWLKLNREFPEEELHHHDVLYVALKELEREIAEGKPDLLGQRLRKYLSERKKKLAS